MCIAQRIYAARNERRLLFLNDPTFEKVREGEAEEEELPAEPEPENPMMYENFLLALQRAGEGDGADTALARALAAQGTYTTPLRIEPADGAPHSRAVRSACSYGAGRAPCRSIP